MAFIFGVATQEADLYRTFRNFITGCATPGSWLFSGAGDGQLNNLIFPAASTAIYETITLTCVSAAARGGTFGVVGSSSGTLPDAVVGAVYKQPQIEFYLDFGPDDFQVGDQFVITAATRPTGTPGFSYFRPLAGSVTETITLTCTSAGQRLIPGVQPFIPADFSVSGSVSGSLPALTQGVAYTSAVAAILLAKDEASETQYTVGQTLTYKTTINPLKAVNQHWETLRQTKAPAATQFGVATPDVDTQLILRGRGLSGTDSVYWGMTRGWSDAESFAYWVSHGMAGYVPTLSIIEQPSVQGGQTGHRPAHTFWGLAVPYVIIASGRCFKLITRSNIYYSQSYAGLFLPSTLPKYYGYPMFVGGTGDSRSLMWSSLSDDRSSFWNYQGGGEGGSAWVLSESLTWEAILGTSGGSRRITSNRVEPYSVDTVYDLRDNLDGTVPAFQVQLCPNRGFLDGVYAVPGRDGRQPEEVMVMRDGKRMLVSQNHHRSGFADFCAFTLE